MRRVRDLLCETRAALPGDDARIDAEHLLTHVLRVPRAWLFAHADDEVDEESRATFNALIARRARGEPVAYLTGTRGFHGIELQVTPDVLIPRAETELLVELALQRIPADAEVRVVDLGTGSGALALAIACERPHVHVLATDASDAALSVARDNAQRLGLFNVEFAPGDWCATLDPSTHFDLIVSNPPYIAEDDPHLAQGDVRFEPRAALIAGADGLDAIRVIVRDAREHLREGGWLLFEHGYDQGEAVRNLLRECRYGDIFTKRDLERRERVSGGRFA